MRAVDPKVAHSYFQLFNLADDIGESNNLIELRPDKLRELVADLARWERDVGIDSIITVPQ